MDLNEITESLLAAASSVGAEVRSPWFYLQVGLIMATAGIAFATGAAVRSKVDVGSLAMRWPAPFRLFLRVLVGSASTAAFAVLVLLERVIMLTSTWPSRSYLLAVAANLAFAWLIIRLVTSVIRNAFIVRLVSLSAWLVAALSILGQLQPAIEALDSVSIVLGDLRLTPLLLIKLGALLLLAIWIATAASNFLDRRVQASPDLTPSMQVLLGKLIRIGMMAIAIIVVLSASGIDLSVFAIATGAVGVGVGLGLQKIVANFVSGIVLLADKSIKPGDVITTGEHFGWVTKMGTRYTTVDLRDGREVLVPNEDLVTQRVINWSYTSDRMQLQIKFNTSYDADIRTTQGAAVEAALSVPQVMKEPAPSCHITAFGATALEYVLWMWIKSASEGPTRVRSAVMVALWDTFAKQGIVIPKPGPTRVILDQPPPG